MVDSWNHIGAGGLAADEQTNKVWQFNYSYLTFLHKLILLWLKVSAVKKVEFLSFTNSLSPLQKLKTLKCGTMMCTKSSCKWGIVCVRQQQQLIPKKAGTNCDWQWSHPAWNDHAGWESVLGVRATMIRWNVLGFYFISFLNCNNTCNYHQREEWEVMLQNKRLR